MLKQIRDWFSNGRLPHGTGGRKPAPNSVPPSDHVEIVNVCCDQPGVHIAYRGKSDDRLYLARDRQWNEVRYYQPNGLRAFCVKCRRRVY
jgi:hypothetical protein